MPLRAIIEGKEINSPFVSIKEWSRLKGEIKNKSIDVIISQTNKKGYLRTSKLGLQHFVHKNGESPQNWKPEKQQHLLAKTEIMLACKESGWEAKSEFISDNCTTDVFAVKAQKKLLFKFNGLNNLTKKQKNNKQCIKMTILEVAGFSKLRQKKLGTEINK